MELIPFVSRTAVLAALTAPLVATAAICPPTGDPCTVDLGHASVTFLQGLNSYAAWAEQINGSEGYFGSSPDFISTFQAVHSPGRDGFSFLPQVYAAVGGGGTNGFHEVRGYFEFYDVRFDPHPGYRIDSVDFVVTGTQDFVGDAYVTLNVPGSIAITGNTFTSTSSYGPELPYLRAEFTTSASYLQGDDGTAVFYGAASAAFGTAQLVANVSAVPEPGSLWLFGVSAPLFAGWCFAHRKRSARNAQVTAAPLH